MAEARHSLDSIDDKNQNKSLQQHASDSNEKYLCKDHGLAFKYFCKDHMVELCLSCKVTVHRKCKTVIDISTVITEVYSKMHSENIVLGIRDLLKELNECKNEAVKLKDDLSIKKQNVIQNVKKTRKSIDSYLDKLEALAINDIDAFFFNETDTLIEQIHICDASVSVLQKRLAYIERVIKAGNDTERFIEINKATTETKQYCSVLQEISHTIVRNDLTFIENEDFVELINMSHSLGTVSIVGNEAGRNLVDSSLIYTGELTLKTETNCDNHIVRYYEVLSDGRQLLLNKEGKALQMYDARDNFLTEIILPVTPLGLALLSDTDALISTSHQRQLHYITISDDLKLSKTKTTNQSIGPMLKCNKFILAFVRTGTKLSLSIMDNHGGIQRSIITDDGTLFVFPAFLTLSSDEKTVYVLDREKGCIGLNLDGQVIFHYQDPGIMSYAGLTLGKNCLYIGVECKQTNCLLVRMLDFTGRSLKDKSCGNSYPLRLEDNKLTVFNSKTGSIRFYFLLL